MIFSDNLIQALQERRTIVKENVAVLMRAVAVAWPLTLQRDLEGKLAAVANGNSSFKSKLRHLQHLASEAIRPMEGIVPCRKGCSACCHINIEISGTEAELIGNAISQSPVHLAPGYHAPPEGSFGRPDTPCPFLVDGACSIYEHRPVVCRNHTVLDIDNLLCGFENTALGMSKDSRAVDKTILSNGTVTETYVRLVHSRKHAIADIRQFFPAALRYRNES